MKNLDKKGKEFAIFCFLYLYTESNNWSLQIFVDKFGKIRGSDLWDKFKQKKDILHFLFTECNSEEIESLL